MRPPREGLRVAELPGVQRLDVGGTAAGSVVVLASPLRRLTLLVRGERGRRIQLIEDDVAEPAVGERAGLDVLARADEAGLQQHFRHVLPRMPRAPGRFRSRCDIYSDNIKDVRHRPGSRLSFTHDQASHRLLR